VTQSDLTGNITAGNVDQFLDLTTRIHPLAIPATAEVLAPYTFGMVLQWNDANHAWTELLSQIDAKRVAENPSWYYYGVPATSYSSGVAGYGFVPGKAAVGWDSCRARPRSPPTNGPQLQPPPLPCGEPDGIDPNYPILDGTIGTMGTTPRRHAEAADDE
jgi:hypothetical protein